MFSQTVEYALRAVVFLAAAPSTPRTSEQIAERTRVPRGYLSKVLKHLSKAGLLHSRRGPHGGFILSRPPEAITVLEVVNIVDPIPRIHVCPLGMQAHAAALCPLHRKLDDTLASIERALDHTTIAEVLEPSDGTAGALCELTVDGRTPDGQQQQKR